MTEVVQALADGNRIARKSSASVWRDSEGRTRRESSMAALGPLAPHDAPRLVFIHDPVAGTSFVLEPEHHTARKLGAAGKAWRDGDRPRRDRGPGAGPGGGRPGPAPRSGRGLVARQSDNLGTQASTASRPRAPGRR